MVAYLIRFRRSTAVIHFSSKGKALSKREGQTDQ